ncbi:MAG: hypothetical protein ACJ788_00050 [Ktedonobacteraceae bacterium]
MIDRSHYKDRQYSLEEIHGKKLHVIFGLSPSESRVYCDEDQSQVIYINKLALVIDMNHQIEALKQHLELHFYRFRYQVREISPYGNLRLPGEEVILIPLYLITFEQEKHPYYDETQNDRGEARESSGSDSRETQEVSG